MRAGQTRHAVRNLAQRRFAEHTIRRSGAAGPAHPLSYLFTPSSVGRIFDGTLAGFFTDSTLTTPCTTPGTDPVGGISHYASVGAMLSQTSSPNKPIYIQNGTASGFRSGTISGNHLWLDGAVNYANEFTTIMVVKRANSGSPSRYLSILNPGGDVVFYSSGNVGYNYDNGTQASTTGASTNPEIFTGFREDNGAQHVRGVLSHTLAGVPFASGTTTGAYGVNLGAETAHVGHLPGFTGDQVDTFFELTIDRYLDPTERGFVISYIAGNAALAGIT